LLKLRGHALVALGRFEDGVLALQQARAIAVEISARPLLWRIDAALGRVFTLLRQTTKAQHYFNTARACVEELADAIADASLRAVFLEGVAAELPSPRPLTPRRAAKQQFGGLTDRERDVAALITRGYSNREIADRLVLSERTVETHVRSILDRLAMSSRAQVAAWAQAHGLGSPTTV
jgi:DNA-binding CsgD family transcriptional regulator